MFYVYPQLVEKYTEGVEAVKERVAHNFQVADLLKTRTKSEFNRVFRTSLLLQQYTFKFAAMHLNPLYLQQKAKCICSLEALLKL